MTNSHKTPKLIGRAGRFMRLDECDPESSCNYAVVYPRGRFEPDAGVVALSVFRRESDGRRYLQVRVSGYELPSGANVPPPPPPPLVLSGHAASLTPY